jgi:hypothetical protein
MFINLYEKIGLSKIKIYHIIFLYTISHIGLFFAINSYYWDDYTLVGVKDSFIIEIFKQNGTFLNIVGNLHVYLLKLGPWVYKVITFFLFLFSGILLSIILNRHEDLDDEFRFYCVTLFLLLPFFLSRTALILLPYVICYFMFFLAWSLNEKYRLMSLFLFFFSYITPSFILFSAVPFFDLYYRKNKSNITFKSFFNFSISNIDFILLPFIFFALKLKFFKPFGAYVNYNENYSFLNLVLSPFRMFKDSILTFYPLISTILILFSLCYLFGIKKSIKINFKNKIFITVSVVIIIIGCFPYWILGLVPTFTEWSNRHQLLLPLGFSIFISIVLLSFFDTNRKLIFYLIISICIFINLKNYVEFYLDWNKQNQLVQVIKSNPVIKENNYFIIRDNTSNAIDRKYRYYEWNGLFYRSFGDESRLGINEKDFLTKEVSKQLLNENPNFASIDSLLHYNQSRCTAFGKSERIKFAKIEINYQDKQSILIGSISFLPKYELKVTPTHF